jgi:geranylgeranyl diphosphate synthase type I
VTATLEPTLDHQASRDDAISREAAAEFVSRAARLRPKLEAALDAWLEAKSRESEKIAADARAPIEAAFDLARRGGKRWRAVLVAGTFEGFHGEGGADAVLLAGVSMELLQVYLLIHDDWMDGDDVRRGGPSVPAMMRKRYPPPGSPKGLADASAILAGDYAAGLALDALLSVPCLPERVAAAARELARVEKEVVAGQLLDMHAPADWSVEATHALKTASYTVRAPILIGARLAGASDEACRALEAYAEPLGVAFQLRDDVLGTFGDPKTTGKPPWSDLRQGKRTALIAEALRGNPPEAKERLRGIGDPNATAADLEGVAAYLAKSGARSRVERRIDELLAGARAALANPQVDADARLFLEGAIPVLGRRES